MKKEEYPVEQSFKVMKTNSTDIAYNLSLEEYLFEHEKTGTYLLLWKNQQSIIVGKYQNVYEEVNIPAIEQAQIPVVRRNTGGGTVFHDLGNLNYSYITDYDPGSFAGYDRFIGPLIKTLNRLGVPAEKKKHSDIVVCGKKISGSAQTVKKGRILHHGTLLFDADLLGLRKFLQPTDGHIESKAVKSVRSSVTNIKDYFTDKGMTLQRLEDELTEGLAEGARIEELALEKAAEEAVKKAAEEKYSSWDWNFGKSPDFTFCKESRESKYPVRVQLLIRKGYIAECQIRLKSSEEEKAELIEERLQNLPYRYEVLKQVLKLLAGSESEKLLYYLF